MSTFGMLWTEGFEGGASQLEDLLLLQCYKKLLSEAQPFRAVLTKVELFAFGYNFFQLYLLTLNSVS